MESKPVYITVRPHRMIPRGMIMLAVLAAFVWGMILGLWLAAHDGETTVVKQMSGPRPAPTYFGRTT